MGSRFRGATSLAATADLTGAYGTSTSRPSQLAFNRPPDTVALPLILATNSRGGPIIWLQTEAGLDWAYEEPEDRAAYPLVDDDIVNYLVRDVYSQAADWSNANIEAYLARPSRTDEP